MQADNEAIARKIRGIRAEHDLTQQDVARILGLSREAVRKREAGLVAYAGWEILRLADATTTPVARFFPETGDAA